MKIKLFLLTTLGTICISLIVFIATYNVAILVSPPYTMLDGKRYGLMPMPQFALAVIVSLATFIPVYIFLFKRIKAFINNNSH